MVEDPNKLVISSGVTSKDDFYDRIAQILKLADWFGRNLDAFNDALRGGCGEVDPAGKIFVWEGSAAAKCHLGDDTWNDIMSIFKDDDESGHESFTVELV